MRFDEPGRENPCRREARAARTEALAAAKAQRASGAAKPVAPSKPPNPEIPSGLKASKTDIAPQLQRDSPPDIVLPQKKYAPDDHWNSGNAFRLRSARSEVAGKPIAVRGFSQFGAGAIHP